MTFVASFTLRAAGLWLRHYHRWLLVVAWAAVQVVCWRYYHAPRLFGDGMGYLTYARHLAGVGEIPPASSDYYLRYVGYALFLSLFLRLGLGLLAIVLAQVALAGLATCAFYATAWRLCGRHWPTAALATAALIGWFEVQAFNAFLLTESLFTSLLILSVWAVARARNARGVGLALGLLLLTALVRPNGFIALVAAGLAGLSWLRQAGRTRALGWLGLVVLALLPLAWSKINWLLSTLGLFDAYAKGTVIFNYAPAALPPPDSVRFPAATASPLGQLIWFVAHNFRYFAQLAALKLVYFLGFPKPWHSGWHVLWAVATWPAIYWLAARGVAFRQVALPVRTYLATCLLLQMAIVALTFEDWDVRFSGPLVPYWLLLAALGSQAAGQQLVRSVFFCRIASARIHRNLLLRRSALRKLRT